MAINKKLIFWKSSTFNPPTSSSDTTKDVLWSAIVFFDSTAGTYANSIWTHGKVFSPGTWGTNQTNYVPLTISGTTYNLSKDGHTHNYAGSATVGGSATTSKALIGDDTRSTNSAPSVYMSGGTRYVGYVGNQTEFKQISVIGAGTFLTGTYCFLETKNPWSDSSGGLPIQVAYGPGTPCWRIATDANTWSVWQALNSGGNADKLDGYHAATTATANTIVQRDGNGYIYGVYINSNRGDENSAAASYIYDSGDGWMRKKTLANVKNELVTKVQIESVLTGNLTTHTHSYLPLAGGTITGQINLTTTTITTPQANTIALAAKSDGLYQKIGTIESKLATPADITNAILRRSPYEYYGGVDISSNLNDVNNTAYINLGTFSDGFTHINVEVELVPWLLSTSNIGSYKKAYVLRMVSASPGVVSIYDSRVIGDIGTTGNKYQIGVPEADGSNNLRIPIKYIGSGNGNGIRAFVRVTGVVSSNIDKVSLSVAAPSAMSAGTQEFMSFRNRLGIGTTVPQNNLDVSGNVAIGSYSGINAAPSNSLIVSGNVGIGTANPTQKIDVIGNALFQSGGSIYLRNASNNSSTKLSDNGATGVNLFTINTGGLDRFVINNSGNVGIGTTNPTTNPTNRLTVSKSLGTSDYISVAQYYLQFKIVNNLGIYGSRALEMGLLDDGIGVIQANEASVGYNSLLLNPAGGNVGIGTTNPNYKLDVNGTFNAATSARSPKFDLGNGWDIRAVSDKLHFSEYDFPKVELNLNGFSFLSWDRIQGIFQGINYPIAAYNPTMTRYYYAGAEVTMTTEGNITASSFETKTGTADQLLVANGTVINKSELATYAAETITNPSGTLTLKLATETVITNTLTSSNSISISLPSPTSGRVNESILIFKIGASLPTITQPSGIVYRISPPSLVINSTWTFVYEQVWNGSSWEIYCSSAKNA